MPQQSAAPGTIWVPHTPVESAGSPPRTEPPPFASAADTSEPDTLRKLAAQVGADESDLTEWNTEEFTAFLKEMQVGFMARPRLLRQHAAAQRAPSASPRSPRRRRSSELPSRQPVPKMKSATTYSCRQDRVEMRKPSPCRHCGDGPCRGDAGWKEMRDSQRRHCSAWR